MRIGVDVGDGLTYLPVVGFLVPDPFLDPCGPICSRSVEEESSSSSTIPKFLRIHGGHSVAVELIDGVFVSIVVRQRDIAHHLDRSLVESARLPPRTRVVVRHPLLLEKAVGADIENLTLRVDSWSVTKSLRSATIRTMGAEEFK